MPPPYPSATRELAQKRLELSGEIETAFKAFGQKVFADGALPAKVKQLIAVAVAHVTQCPYCIGVTRTQRSDMLRHSKSLWKQSGSQRKCELEELTLIR